MTQATRLSRVGFAPISKAFRWDHWIHDVLPRGCEALQGGHEAWRSEYGLIALDKQFEETCAIFLVRVDGAEARSAPRCACGLVPA